MAYRHLHPPLTTVEKTLVDTFCVSKPCELLRALCMRPALGRDENREAFYAACRTICTRVHFCPLEGGMRFMDADGSGRSCLAAPADRVAPSP